MDAIRRRQGTHQHGVGDGCVCDIEGELNLGLGDRRGRRGRGGGEGGGGGSSEVTTTAMGSMEPVGPNSSIRGAVSTFPPSFALIAASASVASASGSVIEVTTLTEPGRILITRIMAADGRFSFRVVM